MENTAANQSAAQATAPVITQTATVPNVTVTQTGNTTTATVEPVNPLLDTGGEAQAAQPPLANGETQAAVQAEWQKQQTTETAIKEDLTKKGLDFDAMAKEYSEYGVLSEASMKALAGAGYPKAVVDAYMEGLEAKTARFVSTVHSFAGGEKGFEQMKAYLATQPQSVIEGFNAAIESGNLAQIQLTMEGIKTAMVRTFGTTNPTIMGGAGGGASSLGYTNPAEMTKDMSDPRYQVDPVFTRAVYQKVQHAKFF